MIETQDLTRQLEQRRKERSAQASVLLAEQEPMTASSNRADVRIWDEALQIDFLNRVGSLE